MSLSDNPEKVVSNEMAWKKFDFQALETSCRHKEKKQCL